MEEYKISVRGGRALAGEVKVSGAKNSSLPIVTATLLSDEPCVIENLPQIEDVKVIIDILIHLGAEVDYNEAEGRLCVDPRTINKTTVPLEYARKLRAGYYFLGALLGAKGEANVGYPGGCAIGIRPIDQHLKAFDMLGAEQSMDEPEFVRLKGKLASTIINFDIVSVGATVNAMLAAAKIDGVTTLKNVAREPHIVDLANFLCAMGADVRGAGLDTIRIHGKPYLKGVTHSIIPDQIETGTLMIAGAATRGDILVKNCIPSHMEALTAKLLEMGIGVQSQDDIIRVRFNKAHRAIKVETKEHPGFPTDLQQPISALLTKANGTSTVIETIFDNRFGHLEEMRRMGADVEIYGQMAKVRGVPSLHGAVVNAADLRGGAALVIAGLMADGITEIRNPHFIQRGYEQLDAKLAGLGADIKYEKLERFDG